MVFAKAIHCPRHFHEELELNIREDDGWQFNYRGTMYSSIKYLGDTTGEAHYADSTSDQDCTFRGYG